MGVMDDERRNSTEEEDVTDTERRGSELERLGVKQIVYCNFR